MNELNTFLLPTALILVSILGYLAQSIGLCMVRGVIEWKNGQSEFLVAILLSGVLAWVALLLAETLQLPTHYRTHGANIWFFIGGIIFGFGSAINQGCGISTLGKLSRGDTKMIFTIQGWIIGWTILAYWNPSTHQVKLLVPSNLSLVILAPLSIALLIWAFIGNKQRKKLWLTMMTIGLFSGFIYLFDAMWPPSGLLHKISQALTHSEKIQWPTTESYYLFIALILGMLCATWHSKKFELVKSNWKQWVLHLVAGTFMGIGGSLALGGNDSQLLLALPTFSPGGLIAVMSMLLGIWLGLLIREYHSINR